MPTNYIDKRKNRIGIGPALLDVIAVVIARTDKQSDSRQTDRDFNLYLRS